MATVKSPLYQKQNGDVVPDAKADGGDFLGRVRAIYFSHTWAADVNAISDVLKLFKLPKGARVLDYHLYWPSSGTTGIGKLGTAASVDLDAAGVAIEAADDDAFGASIDAGGQAAVLDRLLVSYAGFGKKYAAEVDVQLQLTEATDASLGDVINGYFLVAMD